MESEARSAINAASTSVRHFIACSTRGRLPDQQLIAYSVERSRGMWLLVFATSRMDRPDPFARMRRNISNTPNHRGRYPTKVYSSASTCRGRQSHACCPLRRRGLPGTRARDPPVQQRALRPRGLLRLARVRSPRVWSRTSTPAVCRRVRQQRIERTSVFFFLALAVRKLDVNKKRRFLG